jgi:hypothetical protein
MPKCPKCGKKFGSLQALNDHFRSLHPNEKFVAPKQASSGRMLLVIVIIIIVAMGSVVGYLIYVQSNPKPQHICFSCVGTPVSSALYQNLSGVSTSTLNLIGSGTGVTSLSTIPSSSTNGSMTNNGKPEVLYIGGEFCPFCAAQRWSLIVALAKFGTFSNLSLWLSSSTDVWSNTATFSFQNASYTSQYISFVAVEHYGQTSGVVLQPLTTSEQNVWNSYDSGGSIPFIDIDNKYTNGNTGSQYQPWVLRVGENGNDGGNAPYNWTQIASQLNNTSGLVPQSIDGAANNLISAICSVTGGQPTSVCSQSFAKQTLAIIPELHSSGGQPIISVVRPIKFTEPVV